MKDDNAMLARKPDSAEVILEIGAEGGCLTIQRFRTPVGIWKFTFVTDESTLTDFLAKEDQFDLVKEYPSVDTFGKAIQ